MKTFAHPIQAHVPACRFARPTIIPGARVLVTYCDAPDGLKSAARASSAKPSASPELTHL